MTTSVAEKLSDLFGSYKAEWLRDSLYDLFREPAYFPELMTYRPCVLIGGRGTGKTTALRSLSYEGQFALSQRRQISFTEIPFIGIYYRVNTNRVAAFSGSQLAESEWRRLFGHYINIILCGSMTKMLRWYRRQYPGRDQLDNEACQIISMSLCVSSANTEIELDAAISRARVSFEAYINNIGIVAPPMLSMQGAPIDLFVEYIGNLSCFDGKKLFFLIDEYENFLDYQQQAVNTLIKHACGNYTFKIGVRELGWRVKITHNENEVLHSPADYVKIVISERLDDTLFEAFARQVCNARLRKLKIDMPTAIDDVGRLFPGMSDDEEAIELGVSQVAASIRKDIGEKCEKNILIWLIALMTSGYFLQTTGLMGKSIALLNLSMKLLTTQRGSNPGSGSINTQVYSLFAQRQLELQKCTVDGPFLLCCVAKILDICSS